MENIFLVGGSGFVGTQLCQLMLARGWRVTVPTRNRASARHLVPSTGVTVLELDVHDAVALRNAVAGHTGVVNLVAILHGDRSAFERVHVVLPRKLARACIAGGVPKLVHISAIGASAERPESAPSMYLRSKGQGEAALLQEANATVPPAFDLTILRPSVIFGAGDKFLNVFASLQRVLPIMPLACANARFQPVWVQDVARAVLRCLEPGAAATLGQPPRVVELCGPEVFTLRELVQLSAQLSGIRAGRGRPVLALPPWLGRLQATLMELAPGEPMMSRDNLDSMRLDNVASGQCATLQLLGITPAALRPVAANYLKPK